MQEPKANRPGDSAVEATGVEAKPPRGEGLPVRVSPEMRAGRTMEVEKILSLVRPGADAQPQSVGLYGTRWIGKTTVLGLVKEQCEKESRAVALHVPLSGYKEKPVEAFFLEFLRRLEAAGETVEPAWKRQPDHKTFENAIARVSARGKTLVLLLDDFENISSNVRFSLDLFAFFRWIPSEYPKHRLAYVTATQRPLWEPFIERNDIKGSPFPNIFHSLRLGPLADTEQRELIAKAMKDKKAAPPSEDRIRHMIYLAGGFPLLLQIVCQVFSEGKAEGVASDDNEMKRLALACQETARPFLAQTWNDLRPEEQEICEVLARNDALPDELRYSKAMKDMMDHGYAALDNESHKLVPALLRRYVRELRNITPTTSFWGHIRNIVGGRKEE